MLSERVLADVRPCVRAQCTRHQRNGDGPCYSADQETSDVGVPRAKEPDAGSDAFGAMRTTATPEWGAGLLQRCYTRRRRNRDGPYYSGVTRDDDATIRAFESSLPRASNALGSDVLTLSLKVRLIANDPYAATRG